MINISVDSIYILGLQKYETETYNAFKSILPLNKTKFIMKEGVGNTHNDGKMQSSLWNILNHNTIDAVSKDIFKNHISIIRNAYYTSREESILILEEDARFPNWNQRKWDRIEKFLMENKHSWDVFYLGYCNWPFLSSFMITKDVVKVCSPLTLHAYILNRAGMKKILSTLEKGNMNYHNMHIDKFFLKIPNFRKYAAFPMVSFQEKCPGLYLKACDKIGLRILFSSFCRFNEHMSLFIPILFIFSISLSLVTVFSKILLKKKY